MTSTTIRISDRVRVGKGKTTWTVVERWDAPDGTPMASLLPDGGYTRGSYPLERLTRLGGAA